jgi:hypothetical protein
MGGSSTGSTARAAGCTCRTPSPVVLQGKFRGQHRGQHPPRFRGHTGTYDPRNQAVCAQLRGSKWAVLGSNQLPQLVDLGQQFAPVRSGALKQHG